MLHLKVHRYAKAIPVLLSDALNPKYVFIPVLMVIGGTCQSALARGYIPTRCGQWYIISQSTNLSFNPLELQLISLPLPFMKMVALCSDKQRCIHGPAVNVPCKLDSVCTVLPRVPSQRELVALKLKRNLAITAIILHV